MNTKCKLCGSSEARDDVQPVPLIESQWLMPTTHGINANYGDPMCISCRARIGTAIGVAVTCIKEAAEQARHIIAASV